MLLIDHMLYDTNDWFLYNLTIFIAKHGTSDKIFLPGHSQRDHPQLRRGQGQHHSGVDSSKCHVWRGRLPGDLFSKCPPWVVVKAEGANNVYLELLLGERICFTNIEELTRYISRRPS